MSHKGFLTMLTECNLYRFTSPCYFTYHGPLASSTLAATNDSIGFISHLENLCKPCLRTNSTHKKRRARQVVSFYLPITAFFVNRTVRDSTCFIRPSLASTNLLFVVAPRDHCISSSHRTS